MLLLAVEGPLTRRILTVAHMSYGLNSLKGVIQGIIQGTSIGVTKGDTKSLDYSLWAIRP